MHTLEVAIFILSITMVMFLLWMKLANIKRIVFLWGITFVVLVLHIILDGMRWQLYPIYVAIFTISHIFYQDSNNNNNNNNALSNFKRKIIFTVSIFLIAVSSLLAFIFPIYELPVPSGDYLIGTESFVIEDENRLEIYSDVQYRKIKIQLWYPTQEVDGYVQEPWIADGSEVVRSLSRDMNLPGFVLDHTINVMSNSFIEAPLSDDFDSYPVIVISHGWRGFRSLHTDYAEELASNGYIVVGIEHTYGSVATVFDKDDIAYLNLDALPERDSNDDFITDANKLVSTYADDITTTINYLEVLNDNSTKFKGTLELSKIGLIGHSTGGGAGVAVALNDDRIGALFGLDSWVEPIQKKEIEKGLDIPSMFIRSETWETGLNNDNLYSLIDRSTYMPELYQIDGTTHLDFAMVHMYSPLVKYIGYSGSIQSDQLISILKISSRSFFNEYLRDGSDNYEIDNWDEVKRVYTK